MGTQPLDGEEPSRVPSRGRTWRGLLFRGLWIAAFTPLLIGFVIAGVLGKPVFLLVFLMWAGALVCILRAEFLNDRARRMTAPSAKLLGARAGWMLIAVILTFGSGGVLRLVLGPH
jgi:hypothetical protein